MLKKISIVISVFFMGIALAEVDEYEYGIAPNYSVNLYTGYPVIKAASFDHYDKSRPVAGISIGTPYGYYANDFYVNANIEIFRYIFRNSHGFPLGMNFREYADGSYQVIPFMFID